MLLFRPNTKFAEPLSIGQHLGLWLWWAGSTAFVVFLLGGIVVGLVDFYGGRPTEWPYTGFDRTAETAWFRPIFEVIHFSVLAAVCWVGGRGALFLFASR
jgi:hypothetical protein